MYIFWPRVLICCLNILVFASFSYQHVPIWWRTKQPTLFVNWREQRKTPMYSELIRLCVEMRSNIRKKGACFGNYYSQRRSKQKPNAQIQDSTSTYARLRLNGGNINHFTLFLMAIWFVCLFDVKYYIAYKHRSSTVIKNDFADSIALPPRFDGTTFFYYVTTYI